MVRLLHRRLDRLAAHLQGILDSEEHSRRCTPTASELKAGFDWQPAPDWQLNADGNFSWTPSINNGDPVDWYDKAIGQATGLYPRIFGFGDRTVDLQVVEVHLQVVLLQRTLHHVGQQHEDEDRPRETLFHE